MSIVTLLRQLVSTAVPTVGIDIAPDRIAGVAFDGQHAKPRLAGHGTERLPVGAIASSATGPNILNRAAVVDALRRVLKQLPGRTSRVGLTVPDSIGSVSFVKLETIPDHTDDLDRLVAWQVRKSVPFRVEEAQIAYTPGMRLGERGREFVVELVRSDIVSEYEAVCSDAGIHAGIVDLASMNLLNIASRTAQPPSGDWLLVHSTQGTSTLAIVRGQNLIFFRNRPTGTDDDFADLVHQSAMYYQDRLNGNGLKRAFFVDGRAVALTEGRPSETIADTLEYRLAMPVDRLEVNLGINLADLDPIAAPIGLLLREN